MAISIEAHEGPPLRWHPDTDVDVHHLSRIDIHARRRLEAKNGRKYAQMIERSSEELDLGLHRRLQSDKFRRIVVVVPRIDIVATIFSLMAT